MPFHPTLARRDLVASEACASNSTGLGTDRKTSLFRDRPARRAVKRALDVWHAAHHCVLLRIDLLFTMSDNTLHRVKDRGETSSGAWTSSFAFDRQLSIGSFRSTAAPLKAWWSQTGSNRRPPACKAGALPTELWPRLRAHRVKTRAWRRGGPGKI